MANFKRDWMYKGNRPNGLTQLINRVYAFVASAGLFPDWMVTLEVTGRKSGKLQIRQADRAASGDRQSRAGTLSGVDAGEQRRMGTEYTRSAGTGLDSQRSPS